MATSLARENANPMRYIKKIEKAGSGSIVTEERYSEYVFKDGAWLRHNYSTNGYQLPDDTYTAEQLAKILANKRYRVYGIR